MNNLVIRPRDTDYVLGSNSPIIFKAVNPSGVWVSRLEFFENQKLGFETNGCVLFAAQESFDAQMDLLISNGSIPSDVVAQFRSMGYMDLGLDGQAHFHSSPRFLQILTGNGFNGNSQPDPWDVMRKYGVLPWSDLPFSASISQAEYLTGITPQMTAKAAQFLSLIGGKAAIQYHFVTNNAPKNIPAFEKALQQAPLCLGIATNDGWNQVTPTDPADIAPNHSIMCYEITGQDCDILDHYVPYEKVLDAEYPIPYALQGIVTPIFPAPLPAPLPANPTIQQESDWLSSISQWLSSLIKQLQGRNLTSNKMNIYNSFISKTNWTLVVTIVLTIANAVVPFMPADVQATVTTVLLALAGIFHVNGVNKAALASAQASVSGTLTPTSGQ